MNASLIWLTGGMFGLIGLTGLLIASRAEATSTYWIGLVTFVLSVAAIFYLIARDDGEPEDDSH